MENILIKNGNVLIYENDDILIKKLDILIKENKIEILSENITDTADCKIIDAENKYIMPGLINCHTHLAMSIFRESFEGCSLYEWLNEKIWPKEENLNEKDVYYATLLSYVEQISTGTTCTNDHYFFSESIRDAAEKAKVRTVLTRVLMDVDGAGQNRIDEFMKLYNSRTENDLITYTVSPHGLYTCTGEYLEKVSKLAKEFKLPVHIHFLESSDEVEDIKKIHGEEGIYVLEKYFSDTKNILAHGVKLDEKDIAILKNMDNGIVHNPVSNLRLGCKIADITKYKQNGINVALGTDGQGSGSNLDMFEAMRLACLLQGGIHENEERINAKDAIKMATINGAKMLGLDSKIGSIEEGKLADLIIINMDEKLNNITMVPNLNAISNIVYNATGRNVETTIVNGQVLMENRKINHIDIDEVLEECKKTVNRLGL
ncbi:MAG: amidohydrolase [Clostridia bacterium]|nr:amidohydrolase [Clostridia bacterium]